MRGFCTSVVLGAAPKGVRSWSLLLGGLAWGQNGRHSASKTPGSLNMDPILHEHIYVVVLQGGEAIAGSVSPLLWPGAAHQAWVPCQPCHRLSETGENGLPPPVVSPCGK